MEAIVDAFEFCFASFLLIFGAGVIFLCIVPWRWSPEDDLIANWAKWFTFPAGTAAVWIIAIGASLIKASLN